MEQLNLNATELLEKDVTFLDKEAQGLVLEVVEVKSVNALEGKAPAIAVLFKVSEGPLKGQITTKQYALTQKAAWVIRNLGLACGFYDVIKDANGEDKKHVSEAFTKNFKAAEGCFILGDSKFNEWNGNKRIRIENEKEIPVPEKSIMPKVDMGRVEGAPMETTNF